MALLEISNEREAVALLCQELGLWTAVEESLASILVRDLRAAKRLADQENAEYCDSYSTPGGIERIRTILEMRLKAERGVIQATHALLACRVPPTVNIVAARVDIGGAGGK